MRSTHIKYVYSFIFRAREHGTAKYFTFIKSRQREKEGGKRKMSKNCYLAILKRVGVIGVTAITDNDYMISILRNSFHCCTHTHTQLILKNGEKFSLINAIQKNTNDK